MGASIIMPPSFAPESATIPEDIGTRQARVSNLSFSVRMHRRGRLSLRSSIFACKRADVARFPDGTWAHA